jgi:predicted nucleic acid-binding protein
VTLLGTGPIVAAATRTDTHHERCAHLLADAPRPLLVPTPVVAEVCYLLERDAGSAIEAQFLYSIAAGTLTALDPTAEDYERMSQLVAQYQSLPLGGVDASVIAIAERLGLREVATLDRRHFSVVRPRHVTTFTLVPDLSS